jgi:LAS seventeen-binding protein 5
LLRHEASFADGQLTDALRHLASDHTTDPRVKKKLLAVFASWHNQFKGDPSMSLVANMYKHTRTDTNSGHRADTSQLATENEYERRRREEKLAIEENKRKAKEAEKSRRLEESKKKRSRSKRKLVNFEQVVYAAIIYPIN